MSSSGPGGYSVGYQSPSGTTASASYRPGPQGSVAAQYGADGSQYSGYANAHGLGYSQSSPDGSSAGGSISSQGGKVKGQGQYNDPADGYGGSGSLQYSHGGLILGGQGTFTGPYGTFSPWGRINLPDNRNWQASQGVAWGAGPLTFVTIAGSENRNGYTDQGNVLWPQYLGGTWDQSIGFQGINSTYQNQSTFNAGPLGTTGLTANGNGLSVQSPIGTVTVPLPSLSSAPVISVSTPKWSPSSW